MTRGTDPLFNFCAQGFQSQLGGVLGDAGDALLLERAAVDASVGLGRAAGREILVFRIGFRDRFVRREGTGERHHDLGELPPVSVGEEILPVRHGGGILQAGFRSSSGAWRSNIYGATED